MNIRKLAHAQAVQGRPDLAAVNIGRYMAAGHVVNSRALRLAWAQYLAKFPHCSGVALSAQAMGRYIAQGIMDED